MSRWILPFEAIDPHDPTERWKTGIPEAHYRRLQNQGHEKSLARILLVNEVLCEPDGTKRIYRGWTKRDKDDCYVYIGAPSRDFRGLEIQTPPPPGFVFLVFILPDGTIEEWTWHKYSDGHFEPDGVSGELTWQANPT